MMKSYQLICSVVYLLGTFAVSHANAAVYKCTTVDRQTNQQQIIYTDTPCDEHNKQTLLNVQTNAINTADMSEDSALDIKIANAVLNRDFQLAKSLATTKEHWRLISMAEGERQTTIRTAPPIVSQAELQDDCAIARSEFEYTSRVHWRDKDLIATKESLMFAACGVAGPGGQNSVVVLGNPYGQIQSRRWIGTPYGPIIHHQPFHNHHSNRNQVIRGGGLSIDYNSKRFGVRAQSSGIQQQTDIRQQFRSSDFSTGKHIDLRQQFR
jgi:hypothetical protein